MLYCPNCQRISQGDCPQCKRKAKKLRNVQPNDPVLLFTSDFMHSTMVEPLLTDNGIPYSKIGTLGAALAMRMGSLLEKFRFYVPYGAYEQAVRIIAETFGADESIMRDLNTLGVDLDAINPANPARVSEQYASPERHDVRRALHRRFTVAEVPYTDWLLDRMNLVPGMRILDIGCGSGDIWIYRTLPDDLHITLADASAGMLEAARTRVSKVENARFDFVQADACDMPFEGEQFDMVLASHMLFHVPDLNAALSEIARVLKRGGYLCATTMSKNNLRELDELCAAHGIRLPHPQNSFNMEDGADILGEYFRGVRRDVYEAMLKVTEAEPLMDYIRSVDSFSEQSEEALAEIRAEIQHRIDRDGSFDISKPTCVFLCR